MNKKNLDTEQILDAIKNMMSDEISVRDSPLPKDIIELTNPLDEAKKPHREKLDILELSNPISDDKNIDINDNQSTNEEKTENLFNDAQIKKAVRNAVESIPSSKLDEIINKELTKIIKEKLNSSKFIISTENKNN
tara:strand:- start:213 stop:620 length:408 start_codon:yes stop_codon:yes gene_type:complete